MCNGSKVDVVSNELWGWVVRIAKINNNSDMIKSSSNTLGNQNNPSRRRP